MNHKIKNLTSRKNFSTNKLFLFAIIFVLVTTCFNAANSQNININKIQTRTYSFNCPANIPQGFEIFNFMNQPPNIPSNPTPTNASTNISINTNISWTGGDPDPEDTVTYDIYFGTSTTPPKIISNQTNLTYTPGTLTYNTLYHWRIIAWDNHSTSTTGPLWHFMTSDIPNLPPYAPGDPIPPNGSIEVSLTTDLTWTGGDPNPGDSVTYDVYFGSSFPLTKIVSNISVTWTVLDTLFYSTTYYWKIIAWDNHQNSNESPIWSFSTKTDSNPPSVAITSPQQGFLYINLGNIIVLQLPIFLSTLIIGRGEVTVTAIDSQSGINRVEFLIDYELKSIDTIAPYSWTWLEPKFLFPYKLTVIAYDNVGNDNSLEMIIWKMF